LRRYARLSGLAAANKRVEGAGGDHKPGMQGGFFPAVEPGGIDIAPQRFAGLHGAAIALQNAGAVGAVLAGGEDAKAAIGAMTLQVGGGACRNAGGASQGTQTVQRPPA
jgi:hypothetical protein